MKKVKIAINGNDIPALVDYLRSHASDRQENMVECIIDNMYDELADEWADAWARNRYRLQDYRVKNKVVRKEFGYSHAILFFMTFNGKNEDPGMHTITQEVCDQIEYQLFKAGPLTLKPNGEIHAKKLLTHGR